MLFYVVSELVRMTCEILTLMFIAYIADDLANFNVVYGSAYVITGIYDSVKKAFYAWNIVEQADI